MRFLFAQPKRARSRSKSPSPPLGAVSVAGDAGGARATVRWSARSVGLLVFTVLFSLVTYARMVKEQPLPMLFSSEIFGEDGVTTPALQDHDFASSSSSEDEVKRLVVCVFSGNPRTASLFATDTLKRMGSGVFEYRVSANRCPPKQPQVRMYYQKYFAELGQQARQNIVDQSDSVVIMGDEFCKCPMDVCAMASARQYYSTAYREYFEKNSLPSLMHLPLGPRLEFKSVVFSEIPLASKRKFLYNLIVSPTSPSRKVLAQSVRRDATTFVHVTPGFAGNASQAKGFIPPDEYREVLLASKFTLCPAGHNPEAFRIFEACEAGSIPVVVLDDEYRHHACADAFAPFIDSNAPFVFLNKWEDLEPALAQVMREGVNTRQFDLRLWYRQYWRDIAAAFECNIHQRVSQRLPELKGTYLVPETCAASDAAEGKSAEDASRLRTPAAQQARRLELVPLITGCGRSGTLSLAAFLRSIGVDAVHEGMKQGAVSVSWLYAAPKDLSGTSFYPFESLSSTRVRRAKIRRAGKGRIFWPVVRIVRHPLKVISSTRRCFCGQGMRSTSRGSMNDFRSWRFVDRFLPRSAGLPVDSIKRSMIYWLEWNLFMNVSATFRIEDLSPAKLVVALGVTQDVDLASLPASVPREPYHVSPAEEKDKLPDVTWSDLAKTDRDMAERIFALAKEFGYEKDHASLGEVLS